MIFHYNPKTKRAYVPCKHVTIHDINSFEDAKQLITDNFDFDAWTYVVQSKTGKPHNFSNIEDAKAFALNKCTKRVAYTVYRNGTAIATFMAKKQLPNWKTVYEQSVGSIGSMAELIMWAHDTGAKYAPARNFRAFKESVQITDGKVRLVINEAAYRFVNNHVETVFINPSVTFHRNGNVIVYDGKKICHKPVTEIYLHCKEETVSALKRALSQLRPELRAIINESDYYDLALNFSRPTYNWAFDTYHKKAWKRKGCRIYVGNYPREIVDESDILNVLAKRAKAPMTKGLKKVYSKNQQNIQLAAFMKRVGFKDVNSYGKLAGMAALIYSNPEKSKEFFSAMIEYIGENRSVKMLMDSDTDLITDTYGLYSLVPKEIAAFIIKNSRNMEEIHDTFCRHASSDNLVEQDIKYSEETRRKYEYDIDGISFRLASSNKDLAIIGAEMGICVGGYANEALRGATTIIKMTQGEKYIACIESKYGRIQQIKAKFNNPVKAEYKKYIDAWLRHGDIQCDCSDYHRIGGLWNSNHNYATVNPNAYRPAGASVLQIVKATHKPVVHKETWLSEKQSILGRKTGTDFDYHVNERAQPYIDPAFVAVDEDELPF